MSTRGRHEREISDCTSCGVPPFQCVTQGGTGRTVHIKSQKNCKVSYLFFLRCGAWKRHGCQGPMLLEQPAQKFSGHPYGVLDFQCLQAFIQDQHTCMRCCQNECQKITVSSFFRMFVFNITLAGFAKYAEVLS